METISVSSPSFLKPGDFFTVAGCYKKRTFWEWLTRKPRELTVFTVTAEVSGQKGEEDEGSGRS